MLAVAAAAGLLAGPMVQAAGQDERVAAFRHLCLPNRLNPGAAVAAFQAAGWAPVAEDAHPELAAISQIERQRAASVGAESETVVLQRGPLFATVNLMTAEITASEIARYATCAIWDFEAVAGIPDGELAAVSPVAPRIRLDLAAGRIVQWDMSGSLAGAGNLQTSFFPEGSPFVPQTGFSGAAIFLTSDLDARP